MDRADVESKARELLPLAEEGDKNALSEELNAMPMQDRVDVARMMESINERRRENSDPALPDLEISISTDSAGNEHLEDIRTKKQESGFLGIKYTDEKDVYDSPGQWAKPFNMPNIVSQAVDTWDDATKKLKGTE